MRCKLGLFIVKIVKMTFPMSPMSPSAVTKVIIEDEQVGGKEATLLI